MIDLLQVKDRTSLSYRVDPVWLEQPYFNICLMMIPWDYIYFRKMNKCIEYGNSISIN